MMRTSFTPDPDRARDDGKDRGVTLIELAVVLVVIGLLAVLSVPAYNSIAERQSGEDDIRQLETILLQARQGAQRTMQQVALRPDDLGIEGVTISRSELRFFPDGTASPATILIQNKTFRLDWLTGHLVEEPTS